MLVGALRRLRLGLRGSAFGRLLRRARVIGAGRRLYEWRVLRTGVHAVDLLGRRLRFAVHCPGDVSRVDSLVNEEDLVRRMLAAMRDGDVWYDVGANAGVIALLLAACGRERGVRVVAFEPEARAAGLLRENLRLNAADNIEVHQVALGAAGGRLRLYVAQKGGSGSHSAVRGHVADTVPVEVPVERAADFARRTGRVPSALKIDVEGAEMEVLAGLAELLEAGAVRDLFIEVHPSTLARAGGSAAGLREWLEKRGYRLVHSQPRGRQLHEHYRRA